MSGGDAAHKLAAPCRHIGADRLLRLLKEIEEEAGKEEVTADLKGQAIEVREAYQSVRRQIRDHLAKMST